MIVILVIGCHKYLHKLNRWFLWENAFQYHLQSLNIKIVYVIGRGNPITNPRPNLYQLDVGDEYEDLPEKVFGAIKHLKNLHDDTLEGIFKTDDDVELQVNILLWIDHLKWIPYWGLNVGHLFDDTIFKEPYIRAKKPLERKMLTKCIHALGVGYYINSSSIAHILKDTSCFTQTYHEDYMIGKTLNSVDIFPINFDFKLKNLFKLLDS
jgi:hypothetical protein